MMSRDSSHILLLSGLRLSECLGLRVKDVDFQNDVLTVRSGKGDKDRQLSFGASELTSVKGKTTAVTMHEIWLSSSMR